jgi:hypothetical protein
VAGGVPDYRVGNVAYQQPAYRTHAAVAHHNQAHVERLGCTEDLLVRISAPEVGLCYLPTFGVDLLSLLFEEQLGVSLCPPEERFPYLVCVVMGAL